MLSYVVMEGPVDGLQALKCLSLNEGLPIALIIGVTFTLWRLSKPVSVADPRDVVRGELAAGLTTGLTVGLLLMALGHWLVFEYVYLIASGGGFYTMSISGQAGVRYVALLLCTRRSDIWLPWRLGRLLHWAYNAGVIRVAGLAYQFRHRELQDYLAAHPFPSYLRQD